MASATLYAWSAEKPTALVVGNSHTKKGREVLFLALHKAALAKGCSCSRALSMDVTLQQACDPLDGSFLFGIREVLTVTGPIECKITMSIRANSNRGGWGETNIRGLMELLGDHPWIWNRGSILQYA